ncbi:MAG: hypothetical protein JST30_15360 [Armatimonadetes bacterium]|nr:hypothetical protein [Armatimonadota bacterium]
MRRLWQERPWPTRSALTAFVLSMVAVVIATFVAWKDPARGGRLPEPYRSDLLANVVENLAFSWFTLGALTAGFGWIVGLAIESYQTN